MKYLFVLGLCVVLLTVCTKVPLTGRKQFNVIPASEINAMSFESYREVIISSTLSTNKEQKDMVVRAGNRIKDAVETFLKDNGEDRVLAGYNWEFNLIQNDNMVNAWAMPGGKVAFYTGILPICEDENGVAVVMGHEVAHAIAKHGNERMSQQLVTQMGGVALSVALSNKPEETQNLFLGAYGVSSAVGMMLPFSRLHESEADEMGLTFMAMAGYDPQHAVDFWTRMRDMGGQKPPEFLSTHPSDDRRISDLQKAMPEALKYYKK